MVNGQWMIKLILVNLNKLIRPIKAIRVAVRIKAKYKQLSLTLMRN
jgi:hypothetical protein